MTSTQHVPVRRLAWADLPRCSELAASREWGAEEGKWGLLFELGEVYGIEDGAGRLISTGALTRYGTDLAAASMVVVAADRERQGFGTRIMRHLLERADGAAVLLHATSMGRPLYETLGFKPFGTVEAHVGAFDRTGAVVGGTTLATVQDFAEIMRLDREVYGADRTALMSRLPTFAEQIRVLRTETGQLAGYGARWRTGALRVIGPIVAPDVIGARALVADLADGVEGELRLDIDTEGDDLSAWASGHGLHPAYTCTHMAHGGLAPMDPDRLHAPLMCALG